MFDRIDGTLLCRLPINMFYSISLELHTNSVRFFSSFLSFPFLIYLSFVSFSLLSTYDIILCSLRENIASSIGTFICNQTGCHYHLFFFLFLFYFSASFLLVSYSQHLPSLWKKTNVQKRTTF